MFISKKKYKNMAIKAKAYEELAAQAANLASGRQLLIEKQENGIKIIEFDKKTYLDFLGSETMVAALTTTINIIDLQKSDIMINRLTNHQYLDREKSIIGMHKNKWETKSRELKEKLGMPL